MHKSTARGVYIPLRLHIEKARIVQYADKENVELVYSTVPNISIVRVINFKNLSTVSNIISLNAVIYYFSYS